MISVCATIHNSPKAVEAFIRSIYDNATGEDFEVILVSDRNPRNEDDMLTRLADSYPRLSLIPLIRDDLISRQWELVPFWGQVYGDKIASHAMDQLMRYENDLFDLWLQYAYGLNLAASKAKGDLLLLTPADFVVMCDAHNLNAVCTGKMTTGNGRFFGHFSLAAPFDMEDGSLRDKYRDALISRGYHTVRTWLRLHYADPKDFKKTVPLDRFWPFNHGIRIVDKKTFEEVGGLRDDFLSKPGPTDIFNRMARALAYGAEHARVRKSIEDLTGFRARMASVPFDDDPPIEYLYPNPCDGDVVRTMQYAEEKWVTKHEPKWDNLWKCQQ